MSIDTMNKKLSLISYQQMWNPVTVPVPVDSALRIDDLKQLIAQYAGLSWIVRSYTSLIKAACINVSELQIAANIDEPTVIAGKCILVPTLTKGVCPND